MPAFFDYSDATIMSLDIKKGDAVKVTSQPQCESFWVEVNSVEGDVITGSVQNNLIRAHSYVLRDIISFDKKNVREHKPESKRFDLSNITEEEMIRAMLGAMMRMTPDEFDQTLNIRNLPAPVKKQSKKRGKQRK